MRVFLTAAVVLVMLFVAVAVCISTSPAETGPRIELQLDSGAVGVEEVEQLACAGCSDSHANELEICETIRKARNASTAGDTMKLSLIAAEKRRIGHEATILKVEVLNVGV